VKLRREPIFGLLSLSDAILMFKKFPSTQKKPRYTKV